MADIKHVDFMTGVSFVGGFFYKVPKDLALNLLESLEQSAAPATVIAQRLSFKRTPDNKYDANAIAVMFDDIHVGHVSRDDAAQLAPIMDAGELDIKVFLVDDIDEQEILTTLRRSSRFPNMKLTVEFTQKAVLWDALISLIEGSR